MTERHTGPALVVEAPWSAVQVLTLGRFQIGGWLHPFTCRIRSDHPDSEGVLIPTSTGWFCPDDTCLFTQNWAYDFMLDPNKVAWEEARYRQFWANITPPLNLMVGPHGSRRCCICFELRTPGELFVDNDGERWDVCDTGTCPRDAGLLT